MRFLFKKIKILFKVDLIKKFFKPATLYKTRLGYAVRNWIYTTNHRRIALNYLTFIFVSGSTGLSLATVIRLEFAYPGVGVLAGDSLQYLSVATAHGVVMVFFMIMPTLFGAFGNFLLPTQLGVHDVAFPRLNSAAFWFLPGGLIMLVQLICIDRRYQRMNCFNIRELQSILKKKFFNDLVSGSEYRGLLHSTMVGVRHRNNSGVLPEADIFSFYSSGATFTNKSKNIQLVDRFLPIRLGVWEVPSWLYTFVDIWVVVVVDVSTYLEVRLTGAPYRLYDVLVQGLWAAHSRVMGELYCLAGVARRLLSCVGGVANTHQVCTVLNQSTLPGSSFFVNTVRANFNYSPVLKLLRSGYGGYDPTNYSSSSSNLTAGLGSVLTLEVSNVVRFTRYSNPLIIYTHKSGNYLGVWGALYPSLTASVVEATKGARRSPWFFSERFKDLLVANYATYNNYFNLNPLLESTSISLCYMASVQPIHNHLNTHSLLKLNHSFVGTRWLALNSLNQKFSRMFTSNTTQQRVLNNWRQLKFTREAWRCKLLTARHQNTIYKRFLGEEGLLWSVDRNARDLLPGWAMITPFSARTRYTAIGKTDVGLMGVLIVLSASIISSANFLVTYRYLSTLNNRKMRDARSFFSESLIVSSWMMIAANPMLVIGIVMLLFDRHWQTSFFDYSGGGDTVLFQHMFWFFGHPEVYIIMIPAFGFVNTILSYYLRKRVSARSSLLYSMYTIAFLGFFVWGHHMYMVGLAHTTRMLFSTLTVMISVPAATKLMHWSVTLVNSFFTMELPFLWAITFIFFFVSGGVSGMCVAHTGMDVLFHDTFYVIGHFHVMLAGSGMMGIFAAVYFYFPSLYGVKYSRVYAYIHFVYYITGQFITVLPMLWLGYCGQPRRILDYPTAFGAWHAVASAGHLLSVFAILSFFLMIFDSVRQGKPALRSNFGAGRLNTRLNFYLFEVNRLGYLQRKSFYSHRFHKNTVLPKTEVNLVQFCSSDTTLFSYVFFSSSKVSPAKTTFTVPKTYQGPTVG